MEYDGRPEAFADGLCFARFLILFGHGDHSRYLHAMLSPPDLAPYRSPSVIGQDILPWANLVLWNALGREPGKDGRPVSQRHARRCAGQSLLLDLLLRCT